MSGEVWTRESHLALYVRMRWMTMLPRVSKVDIAFVVIAAGNIAARSKAWDENNTRGNPKRVEVSSHSSTRSPNLTW